MASFISPNGKIGKAMPDLDTLMKTWTRNLLEAALRKLTSDYVRVGDRNDIKGILRICELPFESREEYLHWWCTERDSSGHVLHGPRMSQREKRRYLVVEAENTVTNQGKTNLLVYAGSPNANSPAWAQYFAVGTGTIAAVQASDGLLATELARQIPASSTVAVPQVDLNTYWNTSTGNGLWSNAAVFGGGTATSTLNTGQMQNHVLFSFNKTNSITVSTDYILIFTG